MIFLYNENKNWAFELEYKCNNTTSSYHILKK